MKITIVSGSHRQQSQSEKVANVVKQVFLENFSGIEPDIFSLAGNPLPLWDESIWDGDETWKERLAPLKKQLGDSDAFVIITPEWHGQVPAGLKNFFLMFSKHELGHKPALIISVSSGTGGSYPVAELRMSSYKNNRLCYLPEHLIIRDVENVLNDDASKNNEKSDSFYRERLQWCLEILIAYGESLKTMRSKTKVIHEKFGNGM